MLGDIPCSARNVCDDLAWFERDFRLEEGVEDLLDKGVLQIESEEVRDVNEMEWS